MPALTGYELAGLMHPHGRPDSVGRKPETPRLQGFVSEVRRGALVPGDVWWGVLCSRDVFLQANHRVLGDQQRFSPVRCNHDRLIRAAADSLGRPCAPSTL